MYRGLLDLWHFSYICCPTIEIQLPVKVGLTKHQIIFFTRIVISFSFFFFSYLFCVTLSCKDILLSNCNMLATAAYFEAEILKITVLFLCCRLSRFRTVQTFKL